MHLLARYSLLPVRHPPQPSSTPARATEQPFRGCSVAAQWSRSRRPPLEKETEVTRRWKVLLTATLALALNPTLASVALAHGGVPDGHEEQVSGFDWSILLVPPEFVLGGVALVGALYAVKVLRG